MTPGIGEPSRVSGPEDEDGSPSCRGNEYEVMLDCRIHRPGEGET